MKLVKVMRVKMFNVKSALFVMLGLVLLSGCDRNVEGQKKRRENRPAPVAVAPIERGEIDAFRMFSGSLEAGASFVVSAKVKGRIMQVLVDLGDVVTKDMMVARIDDAEYKQSLAKEKADLMVAKANLAEAKSLLEIAGRTLERTTTLHERGVTSDKDLDTVRSDYLAQGAKVAVYEAEVARGRALVNQGKLQVGDATVKAVWSGDDSVRVVAKRYVDDGAIVQANTPLLEIVDLTPLTAVFFVPEKEYGSLQVGQTVSLQTDAFGNEQFEGAISRIAPVFENSSRQARVEVRLPNEDERLKPGMFVKAKVKVKSVSKAVIVPADAIVTRDDTQGVFIIKKGTPTAHWREVIVGIRHGNRVEVQGEDLDGLVVTLGQQLIEDGSPVNYEAGVSVRRKSRRDQ
ncbi:MAG: efflux RND transporter periplasmic adaptor subunit [Deltaproteobacteria bacterium]|nr:efflux RND transporter periplasmic adaptor subunit [Deltaproteobacteria bacterium]